MLTGTVIATGIALATCSLNPIVPADDVVAVCSIITQTCTLAPQAEPAADAADEKSDEPSSFEIALLTLHLVPEGEAADAPGFRFKVEAGCDSPTLSLVPLDSDDIGPAHRLQFALPGGIAPEFEVTLFLKLNGWMPSLTVNVERVEAEADEATASCQPKCDFCPPDCPASVG